MNPNQNFKTSYFFDSGSDTDDKLDEEIEGIEGTEEVYKGRHMDMTQFIEIQTILLRCHASTTIGIVPVSMLSNLFNEQYNFGQLNFWKKADATYYPEVKKLTKHIFTIPTTSNMCLRVAEKVKSYYSSLLYLFPDASHVEIQQRTLMHHWDN